MAEPSYALKLLESAIDWSEGLGFVPHPEALEALQLYRGVEAAACRETFPFGLDGKPHFVAGPNDNAAKVDRVMRTLQANVGEGNFRFTVPLEPGAGVLAGDDEDDDALVEMEEVFAQLPPEARRQALALSRKEMSAAMGSDSPDAD